MNIQELLFHNCLLGLLLAFFCYLMLTHRRILLLLIGILTLVLTLQFRYSSDQQPEAWMGYIKMLALLPLGLGSIVSFGLLPEPMRRRCLFSFSVFINGAVAGNILMMSFTPSSGTYRGLCGRVTCVLLLIWLLCEMAKVRWHTVRSEGPYFIFTASPLSWVLCHAIYRFSLLSLPSFESLHYLLLEPLSLGVMYLFYRTQGRRHPLSYSFGMADTLVVTVFALGSRLSELMGHKIPRLSQDISSLHAYDLSFVALHCLVALVALRAIGIHWRSSSPHPAPSSE